MVEVAPLLLRVIKFIYEFSIFVNTFSINSIYLRSVYLATSIRLTHDDCEEMWISKSHTGKIFVLLSWSFYQGNNLPLRHVLTKKKTWCLPILLFRYIIKVYFFHGDYAHLSWVQSSFCCLFAFNFSIDFRSANNFGKFETYFYFDESWIFNILALVCSEWAK